MLHHHAVVPPSSLLPVQPMATTSQAEPVCECAAVGTGKVYAFQHTQSVRKEQQAGLPGGYICPTDNYAPHTNPFFLYYYFCGQLMGVNNWTR